MTKLLRLRVMPAGPARFADQLQVSEALLAKINALPGVLKPLTAEEVVVLGVAAFNDQPFADGRRRIRTGAVRKLVELAGGVPVMLNHDIFSRNALPVGQTIDAQLSQENGALWGNLRFYMLRAAGGEELGAAIKGGQIKESSIGAFFRKFLCSICDGAIGECDHVPMATYDGKQCLFEYDEPELFDEWSFVYRGAVKGTHFYLAARDELDAEDAELAEAREIARPRPPAPTGWTRLFPSRPERRERLQRWMQGKTAKQTQTVILAKSRFETKDDALSWMKDHEQFRHDKVDETGESWRFRQFDPELCEPGSFRNKQIDEGVTITICAKRE